MSMSGDNLNTHTLAALYTAFGPGEANRITDRLEIHYMPKYGSWLKIAEIELAILSRQCLAERTPNRKRLPEKQPWGEQRKETTTAMH